MRGTNSGPLGRLGAKTIEANGPDLGTSPLKMDIAATSSQIAEDLAMKEFKREDLLRQRGTQNNWAALFVFLFCLRLTLAPLPIQLIRSAAPFQALLLVADLLVFLIVVILARVRIAVLDRQIDSLEPDIAQKRGRVEYLRNLARARE